MDIAFLALIGLLAALTIGFAAACARLGDGK